MAAEHDISTRQIAGHLARALIELHYALGDLVRLGPASPASPEPDGYDPEHLRALWLARRLVESVVDANPGDAQAA